MPTKVASPKHLKPGDYYEDCCFHPCLCTDVDTSTGGMAISGISLVNGSSPRGCSVPGCAVRRLTFEEAMEWRFFGPRDAEVAEEDRWWIPFTAIPSWLEYPKRKRG